MVCDAVGHTTFCKSVNRLGHSGYVVFYGQASEAVGDYTAKREELLHQANEVLHRVANGEVELNIGLTLPLSEAT